MPTLTNEQNKAVRHAGFLMNDPDNSDIVGMGMPAFAGCGKSFTLVEIAKALTRHRILFLNFNRANNEEMKIKTRDLRHVTCKTGHGLAYGPIIGAGRLAKDRLGPSLMKMVYALQYDHGRIIRKYGVANYYDRKKQHDNERAAATVIIQTVNKFLQSNNNEIEWRHVPYPAVLAVEEEDQWDFREDVVNAAWEVWQGLISAEDSDFPITHDVYLKVFALRKPQLGYDLILYDEAQDANPVILGLVKAQRDTKLVMVGDTHQAIYEFRGAKDAMKEAPGEQLPLTQSFRFGSEIAEWANLVLRMKGEPKELIGSGPSGQVMDITDITSQDLMMDAIGWEEDGQAAILCRSNAGVVREAISALASGVDKTEMAVVGGTKGPVEDLRGAWELHEGRQPKHEEFGMLKDWDELVELSESDEGGSYRPIVKMIDEYGEEIPQLCDDLDSLRTKDTDPRVQLVISTAHKAKGREWEVVYISDDFPEIVKINEDTGETTINESEANLLYVTVTRALRQLNLGGMGVKIRHWAQLMGVEEFPLARVEDYVAGEITRVEPIDAELMEQGMDEAVQEQIESNEDDFGMGYVHLVADVNAVMKQLPEDHEAHELLRQARDLLF